jgi:ADP-heptose:LPS heptosyltransferase
VQTSFLKGLDAVLYPGACFLASVLPKSGRAPSGKRLVLRPGGLGDLICADIALQELALDARDFTWLIERRSKPWALFRGLPHLCYDENPLKTLSQMRDRYSLVIDTEQFFGLTEACALFSRSKGGRVFSFGTNRASAWSDATIAYDWRDRHETVEFARLFATALDIAEPTAPRGPRPRLYVPSVPPLVAIAGRQSRSRRLSLDAWTALISRWHQKRFFLIAAAPEDAEFAGQLTRRFDGLASRFMGGFEELCEQMARSEEIFTMDGGAVHIASFFGVPTLALFTSGRDRKWHPLGEGSRILRRHDLACQPCTKFGQVPPCPYGYACLKLEEVEAEKVW